MVHYHIPRNSLVSIHIQIMSQDNLDEMDGEGLVEFCRNYGIDLFHSFSEVEFKQIYDHGKIPCLDNWPESIALDDLMTQSALQSFTKDQNALDDRIRSFLA